VIPARPQNGALRDLDLVWTLFLLTAAAVFATYWRVPPAQLWKVHSTGLVGGAGRALVFLSFSAALAAIAVAALVVDRLDDRRANVVGVATLCLCATVALPGVQTENHLDAKWANIPAVLGVGLALALTLWAHARGSRERSVTTAAGDAARLAVGAVSLFFAAPYIAAELGFFLDGVPVLGWIFQTGALRPEPGSGSIHAAVHHGHHHGMDGFLLAVTALLLSRHVETIRRPLLRGVTRFYLAVMLVYGLTNEAEDLWTEQVVKRGWTTWQIPNVLHPSLSAAWAAMLAAAAVVYALLVRRRRRYRPVSSSSIHSDIGT
jgi:hypothetical protein